VYLWPFSEVNLDKIRISEREIGIVLFASSYLKIEGFSFKGYFGNAIVNYNTGGQHFGKGLAIRNNIFSKVKGNVLDISYYITY
jgi:hypothetical protein